MMISVPDPVMFAPPPVSVLAQTTVYTVPPSMGFLTSSGLAPAHTTEPFPYQALQPHIGLPYQAPPPINITFSEPSTPTHVAPIAPPTNFLPGTETEQERRMKKMEETIKALQASDPRHNTSYLDSTLFSGMQLPAKVKAELSKKFVEQYQYNIETPPSFLELSTIEMVEGQKFEDYATNWHSEAAKHFPPICEAQQIQIFHGTLKGASYSHLMGYKSTFSEMIMAGKQPRHLRKKLSTTTSLLRPHSIGPRLRELLSRGSEPQPRKTNRAVRRNPGSAYSSRLCLPHSPTYTSNYWRDQSLHCEYHSGAPGHTADNCWKLREEVRKLIDAKKISFNAIRPPNVQANPLPDHGSSSGPTVNMISVCTVREDESQQEDPAPFVIEYVPAEATIWFTGSSIELAPFIIEVPARELYQDSKVPWTYEGSVGNLEQQFSVMGVTRSGRVYENPETTGKGKAPVASGAALEASPISQKKVTEEKAEAFMKVIKASEYKQMNVDLNCVRPSKTAVRAFDGSRREVNGEIDLLIDVNPCSFNITFQVLDILNAFSLLLGRPWIHSAKAVPSSLHQRIKFIAEGRLITVKGEEDYTIYNETTIPYISIGDDENLPFHSFETISVIRDYGEVRPSRADRMVGKVLLRHNYIPGTGLGAQEQGINRPIEIEEYKNRRGFSFRPSYHKIIEACRGKHLHRLAAHYKKINRGIPVLPLSHFFPAPPHIVGGTLDGPFSVSDVEPIDLSAIYAVTEETPLEVHIRLAEENEELNNWTSVPRYSAVIADVLHSNSNLRHDNSNTSEERLEEPRPIYFGEGLDEDGRVPEIEESLRRLKDRQLTSVEPTKEINMGTEEESRTLKIGTSLDPIQRTRMIDFFKEYQEVFAWSYANMPGFVVSERGIEVDPDKVKAIRELPQPSTVREVRGFLGQLNYIAHFIANLTDKCQPLFHLLLKNAAIKWDEECQKAFDTIKAYLVQPPVLVPPTPDRRLVLYLTVHRQSLGCMLGQKDEFTHAEHAIYYLSKKFTQGESNYPEIEKMCCSLLTEYDIEYVPRTSVKGQAIADHLAEFPIEDDTPVNSDFPDEGILQVDSEENKFAWKMYFDGAVNSTRFSIGAVLTSSDGCYYLIATKVYFPYTNNVAEYEACIIGLQAVIDFKACIIGLQAVIDFKVKELEVFGDSMLIIFQTLGQWKTKDAKLVPYHEYLKELEENFEKISFTYTPRIKNQFADELATLASMVTITKENLIEPLKIEIAKGPAHCDAIEATNEQPCVVEAASKNIKKIIEKMTVTYKDWHEMLPFALFAYRTSIRYSLVYGMEAVLPIEVEIPSMRLNLIDEKQLTALCHGQCYQQRMAQAFNARVHHREFNPGDLVLRKVLHITPDSRGKFAYKLHAHVASAHLVIGTCTLSIYDHL
ncbi:hypothetical protein CRG98_045304 [Punica granatum]|uniref:G-patch domain-containing protein n=1 Tax=Punica granatum TaxID=22663 RepID=A0A2I0HSR0_PUNGR|nr:hypothetical protein CRG98_045304 [Punica granatum]